MTRGDLMRGAYDRRIPHGHTRALMQEGPKGYTPPA